MSEYKFFGKSEISASGISYALNKLNFESMPVIVCVGTDITIGDSLGPIVASLLIEKDLPFIIYGSLATPVTAQDICFVKSFVKNAHPYSPILTVDAAVGEPSEVGYIKVLSSGIKPGLGANKNLPLLGDASIIGIVAKKSQNNHALFHETRLGFVYGLAKIIALGIEEYFLNKQNLSTAKPDALSKIV